MGYQLVRQVTTLALAGRLPGLSDRAHLVLLGMADVAHDTGTKTTPQGVYFGGWERLAMAWLRFPKFTKAAQEAVRRAIAELVTAGLITPLGRHGGRHGPREYLLNIHL